MSDAPGVVRPDFLFSQIKNVSFASGGWLGMWADRFNFPSQVSGFTLPGISGGTSGFPVIPNPSNTRFFGVDGTQPYTLKKSDLTTQVTAGAGKGVIGFFIAQFPTDGGSGMWMLNLASISSRPFQVQFNTNFIRSFAVWTWKGKDIKAGGGVLLSNLQIPYIATPTAAHLLTNPPGAVTVDPKTLDIS